MINAIEIAPAADRVVALIAFDEAVLGPHEERFEGESLLGGQLRDQDIPVLEQQAVGAENQRVRIGRRIHRGAEIDAEVLNLGLLGWIDNSPAESLFGDFEVGFDQQR